MIKLEKPTDEIEKVFNDCLPQHSADDKSDERLRRLQCCEKDIIRESNEYDNKASTADLYKLHPIDNKADKQIKEDMKYLYDARFRKANCGSYYTRLRFKAHFCPYCGKGFSTTTPELDHFLPKAFYPLLSITPTNLVPACRECNRIKHGQVLQVKNKQMIHPYYEDISDEVWIKAEVIHDDEEYETFGFSFKVDCPANWSELMQERAKNHFNRLNLARRYPIMIGEALSTFLDIVKCYYRENEIEEGKRLAYENTERVLKSNENSLHKNHYKVIMLRALLEDNWFWDEFMVAKMQKEGKLK